MDEFRRVHDQLVRLTKEPPRATGCTNGQMFALGAMILFFNLIAILALCGN